jgi:hypothetical protein
MKLVLLSLLLALVVLTGYSKPVGASTSSRSGPDAARSFCGVAKGVARDIVNSTAMSNALPANIKIFYEKIAAAEPALLASAPGPIKSDLRPVFGFVNLVIVDYKKVSWNPRRMGPYLPALVARGRTVQAPLHALKVYFNTTCHINV